MVLLARDIMDTKVLTVAASDSALSVAHTLTENRKGYAVLLDEHGGVAGIVTEWDFLSKIVAPGADASRIAISSIASPIVHSCTPDTPAEDVVQKMANEGIRRLVVRTSERVVGIITARDVLAMFRQYVDKLSTQIASYHSDPATLA